MLLSEINQPTLQKLINEADDYISDKILGPFEIYTKITTTKGYDGTTNSRGEPIFNHKIPFYNIHVRYHPEAKLKATIGRDPSLISGGVPNVITQLIRLWQNKKYVRLTGNSDFPPGEGWKTATSHSRRQPELTEKL